MLRNKSIHELRNIAQSFGVGDIFSKDPVQLAQEIEIKQQKLIPEKPVPVPPPVYDARLMTKPPAMLGSQQEIIRLLEQHTARGLHLSFPDPENWHMQHGKKEDTGSMRIPLRIILKCADSVMK